MSTSYKVHNIRFYDLPPRSAHCLAYSKSRNQLALSRADYSIEIWYLGHKNERHKNKGNIAPVLQRIIPAHETQGSVEALVWAGDENRCKPTNQISSDIEDEGNLSDDSSKPSVVTKGSKTSPTNLLKNLKSRSSALGDNRLFSTGLHGLLIEHDLDKVDHLSTTDNSYNQDKQTVWSVTSGAAWCMSYNSRAKKLAVGTEEGYVSLFRVGGINGLDFDKVLDKQEGRILCLNWHSDGKHIVTGSPDTIRLWDAVTGHPLTRMSTGRTEKHRETTVWSLIILDDFTVVSGDSRGKTSFWNGRTGTLTDAYQTHIADVLTIATNEEQSIVYSSGVDPNIMQFQPISTNSQWNHKNTFVNSNADKRDQWNGVSNGAAQKRPKWVKTSHRSANTHDVRSIICVGKKVISVGVDANLCISDTFARTLVKHPPIPHGVNVVVATKNSANENGVYVALRYESRIEVWLLGQTLNVNMNNEETMRSGWKNKYLPLKEDAKKLISLSSKDNVPIINFDMACNGTALAYITSDSSVRIFQIELEANCKDQSSLPKMTRIPFKNRSSSQKEDINCNKLSGYNIIKFVPSSNESQVKFLLSTYGGTLQCYELTIGQNEESSDASMLWSLSPNECLDICSGIAHLEAHPNGLACAIASYDGTVRLINMRSTMLKENIMTKPTVHKVPSYNLAIVSSMAFSPKIEGNLLIAYANHHFVEINSLNGQYTEFTNRIMTIPKKYRQLPKEWNEKLFSTKAISFLEDTKSNLKDNELIVFYDEGNICTFDKHAWFKNIQEAKTNEISLDLETNGPSTKSAKKNKGDSASVVSKTEAKPSMRITKKYEHLIYFGSHNVQAVGIKSNSTSKSIDNKENKNSTVPTVVAVEVKPQFLESQLPPSVRRKKFGAM